MEDSKPVGKYHRILLLEVGLGKDSKMGFGEPQMHLGLGYLAAALESPYAKFAYDCTILQRPFVGESDLSIWIDEFDVFAFTSYSCNWDTTCAIANEITALAAPEKDVITVIGGPHATGSPGLAAKAFDYVVIGEGEETFIELLDTLNSEGAVAGMPGVVYDDGSGLRRSSKRDRIKNLDQYGSPKRPDDMWDVFPGMPPIPIGTKRFSPITFSRGCPYNCSYCNNFNMYAIRGGRPERISRDPGKVVDEMELLGDEHGVNCFYMHEEDIAWDNDFILTFCKEIIRRRLDVSWCGMASIAAFRDSAVRSDLLHQMREAGCYALNFGFERAPSDQDFFQDFHRIWGSRSQSEVIDDCFAAAIFPAVLIMIGVPGETRSKLRELESYLLEFTKALRFRIGFMYPLVGTVLREDVERGKLELIDTSLLSDKYATTDHPAMGGDLSIEELCRERSEMERRLYTGSAYRSRILEFAELDRNQSRPLFDLDRWRDDVNAYLLDHPEGLLEW